MTPVDGTCGLCDGEATDCTFRWNQSLYLRLDKWTNYSNCYRSLPRGVYSVLVTDANGCTAVFDVNVGDIGGPTLQNIEYYPGFL